jgi:hypothetical protein
MPSDTLSAFLPRLVSAVKPILPRTRMEIVMMMSRTNRISVLMLLWIVIQYSWRFLWQVFPRFPNRVSSPPRPYLRSYILTNMVKIVT